MQRKQLVTLFAATLFAATTATTALATRLEKPDAGASRETQATGCEGCRVYVHATRSGPMRLDRHARGDLAPVPQNMCSDPGVTAWFPEEGEHLSAFLNSQAAEFK